MGPVGRSTAPGMLLWCPMADPVSPACACLCLLHPPQRCSPLMASPHSGRNAARACSASASALGRKEAICVRTHTGGVSSRRICKSGFLTANQHSAGFSDLLHMLAMSSMKILISKGQNSAQKSPQFGAPPPTALAEATSLQRLAKPGHH